MNSQFLRLNLTDFQKGLVVAVLSPLVLAVYNTFNQWAAGQPFSFDWHTLLKVALAAGIGYLGKNLLSDEQGKVFGAIG